MHILTIASRESALAMWQAEHIRDRLRVLHPACTVKNYQLIGNVVATGLCNCRACACVLMPIHSASPLRTPAPKPALLLCM